MWLLHDLPDPKRACIIRMLINKFIFIQYNRYSVGMNTYDLGYNKYIVNAHKIRANMPCYCNMFL